MKRQPRLFAVPVVLEPNHDLLRESLAIAKGANIRPTAAHIKALCQWVDDAYVLMDRAISVSREACLTIEKIDAQARVSGWAHRCRHVRVGGTRRKLMSISTHQAIDAIMHTIVDAVNDTENVLGSGKKGFGLGAYSNLLTDIMEIASNISTLPDEVKSLDANTIAGLIDAAASKLEIPDGHAQNIVHASIALLDNLLKNTLGDVENVVAAVQSKPAP